MGAPPALRFDASAAAGVPQLLPAPQHRAQLGLVTLEAIDEPEPAAAVARVASDTDGDAAIVKPEPMDVDEPARPRGHDTSPRTGETDAAQTTANSEGASALVTAAEQPFVSAASDDDGDGDDDGVAAADGVGAASTVRKPKRTKCTAVT
jgi:hypothetical protein